MVYLSNGNESENVIYYLQMGWSVCMFKHGVTRYFCLVRYLSISRKKKADNLIFGCKMFFDACMTKMHTTNFFN